MCEQLNFWRQTCQNIGGRLPHGILNFPPDFPRKIKERSRTVMLFQEIESQYIGFIGVLVISSKRIEFNSRVRPMKLRVCIQAKGKRERLSFFSFHETQNARRNGYWLFKQHVSSWLFAIVITKIII